MSKRCDQLRKKVESKEYSLEDAIKLVKKLATAKFDETVEIAVKLGVDTRRSDQVVRGSSILRHGLGKKIRVLVFAKGEKEKEALDAGADFVGGADLVSRITGGWLEFDRVVATPDMMSTVSKLGRILGPRGLMPNPKVGTVTMNLDKIIPQIKSGQVEFRTEKGGVIHAPIGKASFDMKKLLENSVDLLEALKRAKPSASKGKYLKSLSISSTMGPGVKLEAADVEKNLS